MNFIGVILIQVSAIREFTQQRAAVNFITPHGFDSDIRNTMGSYFGYKAYIGMDKNTGLAHHVEVTSVNVHDVAVISDLLTSEETEVYDDSGYMGTDKREDAITRNKQGKVVRYKVNRRPSQNENNTIRS